MPVSANIENLVPLPYRHVSVQPYAGPMTEAAIVSHLLGRDSYRRTRYIILEQADRCAVAAVDRDSEVPLFSDITSVSVLALPDTCVLVRDNSVDPGNPTSLANKALALGLGQDSTLVVHGMDGHVNFIHHPAPLKVRVIEVVPPHPPKLLRLAEKVLSYADDLPPMHLTFEPISLEELAAQTPDAEAYLIPCRASGLNFSAPTYFLDERPARQKWTMIACERSRQIHRHFYGDEAPRVEMCPHKLTQESGSLTLLKCCLLEDHIDVEDNCVIVPWGATLAQVRDGLHALANIHAATRGGETNRESLA